MDPTRADTDASTAGRASHAPDAEAAAASSGAKAWATRIGPNALTSMQRRSEAWVTRARPVSGAITPGTCSTPAALSSRST